MSASSARSELERLLSQLLRSNLAIETNAPIIKRDNAVVLVTWSGSRNQEPFSPEGQFASITEYRRLLSEREFLCLLFDGSLVQVSYAYDRNEMIKHRMVYFPCPLILNLSEGDENEGRTLVEAFDEQLLVATKDLVQADEANAAPTDSALRLRSPLRFDYDIRAMRPGHPGAHLHLSQETVRWAMFGPLCLGKFVRFIFQHFYPTAWEAHAFLREWPVTFSDRSISEAEEKHLFIDCRPSPPQRATA